MPGDRSAGIARTAGPRMMTLPNVSGRAAIVFAVSILYLPLFRELTHLSSSHPYAGHVVFVPLLAAVVVWVERHRLHNLTGPRAAAGPTLTGLAVILGGIAYYIADIRLHVVSFVAAMAGLLLSFYGRRGVRAAIFPLGMLVLMIPPPQEAMTAFALRVQHFVAAFSGIILSSFGVPVVHEGLLLRLPGLTLTVAEECSGLRFLLVLSVFAAVLGRLFARPSSRLALILVSVPIAVLANAVRIAITGAGAYAVGPEVATGPLHYYIGKACWAGALVVMVGAALWCRSRAAGTAPSGHSAGPVRVVNVP